MQFYPCSRERGTRPVLLLLVLGLFGGISHAATFVVTKIDDTDGTCNSGVDCSLREAIKIANSSANADANTPDEITFAIPDAEKVGGVWTIALGSELPSIDDDVNIIGPGANLLTVEEAGPGGNFFILTVGTGKSTIVSGLTLSNGGFGLVNFGTVTATNCIFSGNGSNGLENNGTATITNCTLSGNNVGLSNSSTATVFNCTFSGNSAVGLGNSSTVTITNCTFSGNSIFGLNNFINSMVTATNCTFSGNNSAGLRNDGTATITNCTVSGNPNIGLYSTGTVTLQNSLLVGNSSNLNVGGSTVNQGADSITTGTAHEAGLETTDNANAVVLKDNGGPTETIALVDPNGTAVNAGDNSLVPNDIITDQRGYGPRINNGTVDIGAYETGTTPLEAPSLVVTTALDTEDAFDGETSLREAINYANSDPDASEITFDATFSGKPAFIELDDELPDLSEDVTITGPAIGIEVEASGGVRAAAACGCGFGFRIFTVDPGITVSISKLTMSNGDEDMGGAIYNDGNLTLTDCSFFDNSADSFGGAIFSTTGSSLTLANCILIGNGSDNAGAIFNQGTLTIIGSTLSINSSFDAGAIYNDGTATILSSTLSGNSAISGGAIVNAGTLTLNNSTVSVNFANSSGGGIDNDGTATISNSTISDNLAGNAGGGIFNSGELTLNNSIVALNTSNFTGSDIRKSSGTIDGDYNLIQATGGWSFNSGGTHNITGQDPLFDGSLTDNGGPTETIALQNDSPARNGGSNALLPADSADLDGDSDTGEPLPFDQRGAGFPRILKGIVDIGAYETRNNAPVLDNSGFVSLTVQGQGSSIEDLLFYSSLGDDIITDPDAGDPEGIAIVGAVTTNGSWQYSLNGGQTWSPLGGVSAVKARLLKSNGESTRLRFLPKNPARASYADQLTFRAWDQASGSEGTFVNPNPNGGNTAFSTATETLSVLVPNDSAAPRVAISTPAYNAVLAQMPAAALGTAGEAGLSSTGIRGVTLRLYRYANPAIGLTAGYWNGDTSNPQFNATYSAAVNERVVNTTNGYANWNLALPAGSSLSAKYYLVATATDGVGKTAKVTQPFTINDGSPSVTISQPLNNQTYNPADLSSATGTAQDSNGISKVVARLYRFADPATGTPAGHWDGNTANPQFEAAYNEATHQHEATLNGSNWTLALPTLGAGAYGLVVTAYDTNHNSSFKSHAFTINDGTPTITITQPLNGRSYLSSNLPNATGTAQDSDGISKVVVRLYRYPNTTTGVVGGYWNGSTATPQFASTYNAALHQHTANLTGSNWSIALPALDGGTYVLRAAAYDTGNNVNFKTHSFHINDGTPQVTITSPQAGVSYPSGSAPGSLDAITGTASDSNANGDPNGDGIVGVTVRLYRKAGSGNSEGYWNGTAFTMPYNQSIHERAAKDTASGGQAAFSTWSISLPPLNVGDYTVLAKAYDSQGNFGQTSTGVQARTAASKTDVSVGEASVSFSIVALPTATAALVSGEVMSSANSIVLTFTGDVPQGQFSVHVNGQTVTVSDVIRSKQQITLLLPANSLQSGDEVKVNWPSGNTTLKAQ